MGSEDFCNERAWSNLKSYRESHTSIADNETDVVDNQNIGQNRERQELVEELENSNEKYAGINNDADGKVKMKEIQRILMMLME